MQRLLDKAQDKQIEADMDGATYQLGDRYISLQRTEEGSHYSIYDEAYHLLDGGIYDSHGATIGETVQGNIRRSDMPVMIDYEELQERLN